jgi:hypothetical protein
VASDDAVLAHHARVLRILARVGLLLAQWDAYEADQALPPKERIGVRQPRVTRASCEQLQARYLAELARIEAGLPYPN